MRPLARAGSRSPYRPAQVFKPAALTSADLIAACLERLDLFRLSHQVEALEDILARVTRAHREVL